MGLAHSIAVPSDQMIGQKQVSECVDRTYGILGLVDEVAGHDIKVDCEYENEQSACW